MTVKCVGSFVNSTAIGRFRSSLELYLNMLGLASKTESRSGAAVFEPVLQSTCYEQMNRDGTVYWEKESGALISAVSY